MSTKFLLVLVGCFLIVADGKNAIKTMKASLKEMKKKMKLKTVDLHHPTKSLTSASLQSWNRYDSAFTSGWYLEIAYYSDAECTDKKNYAFEAFETNCLRGSIVSNENVTYGSGQAAFNRDGSEQTIVFFENGNCEGTPSIQANTRPYPAFPFLNSCSFTNGDYVKTTLRQTALGNPFDDIAAKYVNFEGSISCDSATVEEILYYKNKGCINDVDDSFALEVVPNHGIVYKYFNCEDCNCGESFTSEPFSKYCEALYTYDHSGGNENYYYGDDNGNDDYDDDDDFDDDDDTMLDDEQFFSLNVNRDESGYWNYDLPQKCVWETGCAGSQCEAGTVCNEFRWWSQCVEDPAVNYIDECISTRNGPGRTAHWGCTKDADCCNEDARCDIASKYCNLPCEQVDAPPDGPLAGAFAADTLSDSKGTGDATQIVVPIVISVVVAGILLALGVYYYVNRSVKGRRVPSSQEEDFGVMTVVIDTEAPTAE